MPCQSKVVLQFHTFYKDNKSPFTKEYALGILNLGKKIVRKFVRISSLPIYSRHHLFISSFSSRGNKNKSDVFRIWRENDVREIAPPGTNEQQHWMCLSYPFFSLCYFRFFVWKKLFSFYHPRNFPRDENCQVVREKGNKFVGFQTGKFKWTPIGFFLQKKTCKS